MKRNIVVLCAVCLTLFGISRLCLAEENEKLNLTIINGKVSADIKNVPLGEVVNELGKKMGTAVEVYKGVNGDRLISIRFKELALDKALYRLLNDTSFFYQEGKKLILLASGSPSPKYITSQPNANSQRMVTSARHYETVPGSRIKEKQMVNKAESLTREGATTQDSEATEVNLDLGEVSNARGGKVTIPITLDTRSQAISVLSNDISYDPNVLANPRATIGEAVSQAGKELVSNETRPGLFRVGVIGLNQTLIPDGVVAYVTFDVLRDGPISLKNRPSASDPSGNSISAIVR
jgi:hypothetical protein